MAKKGAFYRKRLSDTNDKVRNVIFLVYMEDLLARGLGYYDLIAYLDSKHCKAVVSPVHDRDTWTSYDVARWCERHLDPETGDLDERFIEWSGEQVLAWCKQHLDPETGDLAKEWVDAAPYVGKPYAPYVGKRKKPHVHVGIVSKSQRTAAQWAEFMEDLLELRPSIFEKMEDYEGFTRYCAHLDSPDKASYSAFDVVSVAGADLSCLSKTDEGERVRNLVQLRDLARKFHIRTYHGLFDFVMDSGDLDMVACFRANSAQFASYFSSTRWENASKKKKGSGESSGEAEDS